MEFIESFQRFQLNFHRNSCMFSFTHNFVLFLIKFNNYNKNTQTELTIISELTIQLVLANGHKYTAKLIINYKQLLSYVHACSVVSNSLQPHGLCSLPGLVLCPWDFPGMNTGVGCHFLLQGIFPIQKSNLHLLHWQTDSLPGKSNVLWVATVWASLVAPHRESACNAGRLDLIPKKIPWRRDGNPL